MNHFVFLYPIPEIIDFEIKINQYRTRNFKQLYKEKLNECIDLRYRKENFQINYVVFDDTPLSDIIKINKEDRILKAGLYFETHKKYIYPNPDFVINQLEEIEKLRIGGFHMWDCVEKFAKRAYERKINVLVDEDLTEFFTSRIRDEDFKTNIYPTFIPRKKGQDFFEDFMRARKTRPWLWQEY